MTISKQYCQWLTMVLGILISSLMGCTGSTSNTQAAASSTITNTYIQQQRLRLHFAREKEARLPTLYPNTKLLKQVSSNQIRNETGYFAQLIDYNQDGNCDDYDASQLVITNSGQVLRQFKQASDAAHDLYGLISLQLRLAGQGNNNTQHCYLQNPESSKRFLTTYNPALFDKRNVERYSVETLNLLRAINRQQLEDSQRNVQQSCSQVQRNQYVHRYFLQNYLWRDLVPEFVDYSDYSSTSELLDAIKAPQDTWSYTQQQQRSTPRKTAIQTLPYTGFSAIAENDRTVIQLVHPQSPAAKAGLQRGDIISDATMSSSQQAVKLDLIRHGKRFTRTVAAINQAEPTVPITTLINANGRGSKIGYMMISQFHSTSRQELTKSLGSLKNQGVKQLIIDVRYNPGGLVDVANYLASSLAPQLNGKIFAYSRLAGARHIVSKRFHKTPLTAPMKKIVFITSKQTISAAEQLIMALRPYIPVAVVGTATRGKAVWLEETTFCDTVLYAVNATAYNIEGDRVPDNGIQPNCQAEDELTYATTSTNSKAIGHALSLLQRNQCM